jgi:2-oxoglutarate ferredoxin oxidoreductase subunit beta
VRHPGFSFIEVLSPCVTFRPEQRAWKEAVHAAPVAPTDDPARAARRIMTDDGFNIGVLYKGSRRPYAGGAVAPATSGAVAPLATIEDLECAFRL